MPLSRVVCYLFSNKRHLSNQGGFFWLGMGARPDVASLGPLAQLGKHSAEGQQEQGVNLRV